MKISLTQMLLLAATISAAMEDGKIDNLEADSLSTLIAPELAKMFPENESTPVEKWAMVDFLVQTAQKTIVIVKSNQEEK